MKKIFLLCLSVILLSFKVDIDKPAYSLFNAEGKLSTYQQLLQDALKSDIILFGEIHNDPICHWLELEIAKDLFKARKTDLILGAEMFETDDQIILDEYIKGHISSKNFEEEAKLWSNYNTDYKPIVEFAKQSALGGQFICTNIPRRYAAIVHKKGFEGLEILSEEAKKYIAPLPIKYVPELNCYKKMTEMSMGKADKETAINLPKAQAIKDATMAYFILKNWKKGKLFLHYNGSYHSDNFEGIYWYLKQQAKDLKILTISTLKQKNIDTLENISKNIADYIICVPENMTTTY